MAAPEEGGKQWWRWRAAGGMMRFYKDAQQEPYGDYQGSLPKSYIVEDVVLGHVCKLVVHSANAPTCPLVCICLQEGFVVPMSFLHYTGLSAVCANIKSETGCHVSFRKRRQGISLLWYHHWEHRYEPHGLLSLVSRSWHQLQAGVAIAEEFVKDVYFAKDLEQRGLAERPLEIAVAEAAETPEVETPAAAPAAAPVEVTSWKAVLRDGIIQAWRPGGAGGSDPAQGSSGPVAQTPPTASEVPAIPSVVAQIRQSETTREQEATTAEEAEAARGDRIRRWRALAKGKGLKQPPCMPIASHADVPALVAARHLCDSAA